MTEQDILKNAEKIISSNQVAMIGTINKKKFPNIRALTIIKSYGFKTFYFNTKCDSDKMVQIKKNKKGCIYFYDTMTFTFSNVLIEGKFTIEPDTIIETPDFYKISSVTNDFCTIKFEAINLYYYAPYQKYKISMKK